MMGYEITGVEGNWIFIRHNLRDELGGFITLLKSIADELDGRINQMDGDEVQYTIQKDPFNLIFKWDTQLGMSVFVNNISDVDSVIDMLVYHFDKLNS